MTGLSDEEREALRAEVHAMRGTDHRGMSNCLHTRNDDESSCRAWADWILASVTVADIVRRARAEALREAAEVVSAHVLVMPRISNGILDEVYARDLAFDLKSAVLDLGADAEQAPGGAREAAEGTSGDPDTPLRATETGLGGSNTCSPVSPGAEDAGRAVKRSRLFADSDEIAGDRAMTRRALGLDDGVRGGGA